MADMPLPEANAEEFYPHFLLLCHSEVQGSQAKGYSMAHCPHPLPCCDPTFTSRLPRRPAIVTAPHSATWGILGEILDEAQRQLEDRVEVVLGRVLWLAPWALSLEHVVKLLDLKEMNKPSSREIGEDEANRGSGSS